MIKLDDFYKKVENKKLHRQKYEVIFLRRLISLFPKRYLYKKVENFSYLTICKKEDLDMVEASIYTLYKNSLYVPNQIIIVSDGSWSKNDIKKKSILKHGLPIKIESWETCAKYYEKSLPSLYKWSKKQIWGKKMASILYFSEFQKILFSDPDILWFSSPLDENELKNCKFKVSIDNCHSYDQNAIKTLGLNELNNREPINCGAVWISGGIDILTSQALDLIEYESIYTGPFAEQTVFALLNIKFNSRWTTNEISSNVDDLLSPFFAKTHKGTIGRHYLWRLKWIYWKDYFTELVM